MFEMEADGSVAAEEEQESQGLLEEFKRYIREHKVVVLEDLASAFKLRTADVVNRVKGLEQMGHITGVIDDRGKFIYISVEEMDAVARFMRLRGRVAIADLVAESNKLVNLTPGKPTDEVAA
eukprot:JP439479.1.p1 GENE.JP439479.1~~JP439479.1.p1  ORF type:complete len:122 (+),score=22.99 JP439479.1:1-366(+)